MSEQLTGNPVVEQEKDSSDELIIDLESDGTQLETNKRKRSTSNESEDEESTTTIESSESIDDKLSSVALKNNLTPAHIKSILKKVVLNEHVMALVMLRDEEETDKTVEELKLEPKLTRAKTKKLKTTAAANVSWPLSPLTPVKVPISVSPEVNALITEELPEEESDEEYEPTFEDHSDDDKEAIDTSDADSLPKTPASPNKSILNVTVEDEVKYTDDGVFKIPQEVPLQEETDKELEATIALRTRSKLCLSDIPIEKIEGEFVPPDFTDTDEIDDVWRDFLEEFSKPLSGDVANTNEDDDEADPEYNAATEINFIDNDEMREELRVDNGVRVSQKELQDLVGELLEDMNGVLDLDPQNFMSSIGDVENSGKLDNIEKSDLIYVPQYNEVEYKVESNNSEIQENQGTNVVINIDDNHHHQTENAMCNPPESHPNTESQQNTITYEGKVYTIYTDVDNSMEDNNKCKYKFFINNNEESKEKTDIQSSQPVIAHQTTCREIFTYDKIILDHKLFTLPAQYTDMPCEENIALTDEQRNLLNQQMRQHVQLATQCYLQLHAHPMYWNLGPSEKEFLMTLKYLSGDNANSAFRPCNLLNAIELCENWEKLLASDTPEINEMMKFILYEIQKMEKHQKRRAVYHGEFPTEFCQFILNSNVFLYEELLPYHPFRLRTTKIDLVDSEIQLIAMGLEQFYEFMNSNRQIYRFTKTDPMGFSNVSELISKYMMPCRNPKRLRYSIKIMRMDKEQNPIKHYFMYGKAPTTINNILKYDVNKTTKDLMHGQVAYRLGWKYFKSRKEHPSSEVYKSLYPVATTKNVSNVAENSNEVIELIDSDHSDSEVRESQEPEAPPGINVENTLIQKQTHTSLSTFVRQSRSVECQHVCDCSVCREKSTEIDLKNQTFITDFFGKSCTKRNKRAQLKVSLVRLLRLVDKEAGSLQSFVVQTGFKSVAQHKRELAILIAELEANMLPSMPFLLGNSRDSLSKSEDPSDRMDTARAVSVPDTVPLPKKKVEDKTPSKPGGSTPGKPKIMQRVGLRAQRELEAIKAMFVAQDPYVDDLKETLYAAAYLDKVKNCLAKNDGAVTFQEFQNILNTFNPDVETPAYLYRKIEKFFDTKYSDLTEEFLTFLTPGQANRIGRFMDHFMLTSMSDFIERLQIYFANKPAQLRKVLWTLEQLADKSDSELTMEMIKSQILPLLKGNQYLIDWFLKLFPNEKPPESLINNGFEIVDCDKLIKDYSEEGSADAGFQFEQLDLPAVQENYGNESCTCSCHRISNDKFKNKSRHCIGCGMRYIQGRVYVQHGRVLRGVHLNWQDSKDQARRLSVPASKTQLNPRRRAISSEPSGTSASARNDSDEERISPKRQMKILRTPTSKSKTSKNAQCSRSLLKSAENTETNTINKNNKISKESSVGMEDDMLETFDEFNNQRELFIKEELKKRDGKDKNDGSIINKELNNKDVENQSNIVNEPTNSYIVKLEIINSDNEDEEMGNCDSSNNVQKTAEEIAKAEQEAVWTREEDKIILTILRNDSDDEGDLMMKFKELLPHRSEEEIRTRFKKVMDLLKKLKI